jgi:hypothetical protein
MITTNSTKLKLKTIQIKTILLTKETQEMEKVQVS